MYFSFARSKYFVIRQILLVIVTDFIMLISENTEMENETAELKGGHAPAVKVAGVRIVQHKPKEEKEVVGKPSEEEKEEFGEDAPVKAPSVIRLSSFLGS